MDKNEAYLSLAAKIKTYERQLSNCYQTYQECVQSSQIAENAIEQHFSLLINTLAARKASLLGEIAHKVSSQKKTVEEAAGKLHTAIEASRKLMEAGALTFGVNEASAEIVWKSLASMPPLQVPNLIVTTVLPEQLRESIQTHGSVGELVSKNKNTNQQSRVTNTLERPSLLEAKPISVQSFPAQFTPVQPPSRPSIPFTSMQSLARALPTQRTICYDIPIAIEGLVDQIHSRFPQATGYSAATLLPHAIITFLYNYSSSTNAMEKYTKLCEERFILGVKHFVVVLNGNADSFRYKCTAQYNLAIDGFFVFRIRDSSINEVFTNIESQL